MDTCSGFYEFRQTQSHVLQRHDDLPWSGQAQNHQLSCSAKLFPSLSWVVRVRKTEGQRAEVIFPMYSLCDAAWWWSCMKWSGSESPSVMFCVVRLRATEGQRSEVHTPMYSLCSAASWWSSMKWSGSESPSVMFCKIVSPPPILSWVVRLRATEGQSQRWQT